MVEPWLHFPFLAMSSSPARGAGRRGLARGEQGKLGSSRSDALLGGAAPVGQASDQGLVQGAEPSEAGRGSGAVHRLGSVEVSVTMFYRYAFQRLLWRVL